MKIKYLNLNRNYKSTKLYKTTKMMLIVSMSIFIGSSNVEAQPNNQDTIIEVSNEQDVSDENTSSISENINQVNAENKINQNVDNHSEIICFNELEDINSYVDEEEIIDERQLVALTFDDGPGKYTMDLIDILSENDVKATFFLLGSCVKKYPDTVVYMYEKGNEIGNHGYSHKRFTQMSLEEIKDEIESTKQLIESYGIECTDFVRPPYRSINNKIVENIDSTFIVWSIDTEDWKSRDVECIKETIIGKIKEGDIILFHDIHKTTVEAIKEILPLLTNEYRFVTVSELFELKEVEYKKNKMYSKVKK